MQIVANSISYNKFQSTIGLDHRQQHYSLNPIFNLVMILKFEKIYALIGGFCSLISITILNMPNTGKDDYDNVAFECPEGLSTVSYTL
jgi:hypothetical protein